MSSSAGRPLTNEAVFRIEVALSSRRSSAIVMRTHARLYTLEKAESQTTPTSNAQWKSIAYGAPCIQLMRDSIEHNSPFHIKVVIAEVESGIALWEAEVTESSGYNAMQTNFHTFSSDGKTFAVQFASEDEGQRMLESIHDLFVQKQKAETVAFGSKPDQAIFKKPKNFKRLNKKDISTPCNFKHVSGITVQRTQVCEDELRGTIQRKMRSMSLSSLVHRRSKVTDGESVDASPAVKRPPKSILNRFGSLKGTKKRGMEEEQLSRGDKQMSLPTHYRRQARPLLSASTFTHGVSGPPNKSLSHSSEDLSSPPARTTRRHPSGSSLERRHTIVVDHHSPKRSTQYNYVPYSKSNGHRGNSPHHTIPRQYSSDVQLNRTHPSATPGGVVRSGVSPPAQLARSQEIHYQVPQTKPPRHSNYHTPLPNHYQAPPSNSYQVPSSNSYQGPSSNGYQGPASSNGYQGPASSNGYQGPASSNGYQGPSSNGYQVPTGKQTAAQNVAHYNVPQSQAESVYKSNRPIPYAVVGVSAHADPVSRWSGAGPHTTHNSLPPHDQLTQRVSPHDQSTQRVSPHDQSTQRVSPHDQSTQKVSPVRGYVSAEVSPSHNQMKVAPVTSHLHKQVAFDSPSNPPLTESMPRDSLASRSSTSVSTQDHLSEVMDVMDKALEQFDSLLQSSQEQRQSIQTVQTSL